MSPAPKSRGLGRGLDALLPTKTPAKKEGETRYAAGNVFDCAIEKIVPQKGQPRQNIDSGALDELAASIRQYGVLEPLVVRRQADDRFELIAGERRWRAAQRAGLHQVMVVVRDVSSKDAFELALIENIQREDLNPIEFAEALQRLLDEHGYSQEALAGRVGKDRSTITNALRLLKLPQKVRSLVVSGQLSEGHGRALLGAPSEAVMLKLADKCVQSKLSVRQVEALVRATKADNGKAGPKGAKTPAIRDLENRLRRHYGARCDVRDTKGKGQIVIHYSDLDELDRILDKML